MTVTYENLRDYLSRINPTWLRGYWGERFTGTLALFGDLCLEGSSHAVRAYLLKSLRSPSDSLPHIGAERNMERYPSDTNDTYRWRLQAAWDSWIHAGSKQGLGRQLTDFGLVKFWIRNNFEWSFEMPKDMNNWSRFVVIVGLPNQYSTVHTYDSGGIYDSSGWTYDSGATVEDITSLWGIIDKWKSAHEICPFLIIITHGHIYDEPGLHYDDPGLVYDDSASAAIIPHP